ncbi:TonB-dependent receptor plug domain-containing protein [Pelagicoccus sp. SDUM812003]|uniref:TonB-dependent receptor plug domain-containing protein n=1 Tax=Pelagicoccus sp. SDUM812003 TaxID=3041267 RepID=UPI00280D11F5|nr:TonB-dependent receptor plug domain-containing protein [Pelagicoccus sp. SDUM812003]MDQ8201956.1 TonB-dependent receptor plug domain-containing protein [Pelagicoccus sp. SDUM812003]
MNNKLCYPWKSRCGYFLLACAMATSASYGQDSANDVEEEVFELSPFEVTADESTGYVATSTLAGSRIRTDLKDVGSAISVVTEEFLKDTGAVNNETLLQYTPSTEVSGLAGNFAGLGNGNALDDTSQRMAPHESTRVRGLSQADNTRDFFLTGVPWDSYNVGRVDLQRGPNAILFGIGAPAGIINTSVNSAHFENEGSVEVRFGSYGSTRLSLDKNFVILEDELALRVSVLDSNTKYQQDPAFNEDQRIFTAVRYEPKFLQSESMSTQLNVKYENGQIDANRPRIMPPGDLISPWWTNADLAAVRQAGGMNPLTLGESDGPTIAALRAAGDLGAGIRGDNSKYFNKAVGAFGRNYGGIVAVFDDPTSGEHSLMTTDISKNVTSVVTLPWTIMSGVIGRKDLEGTLQTADNYDFYKDERLQDTSIFDFRNKLIDGPNKSEWSNFDVLNASFSQTFLNNKVGYDLAVYEESLDRGQTNLTSDFGQAITIDLNNHLVDGSVNPNYGRAAMISDQFANNSYDSERSAQRLTLFGEFDAVDSMGDSALSNFIGRHVFTGLLSNDEHQWENRNWFRYAAPLEYGLEYIGGDPLLRNRTVNVLTYLSDNIADRSSIRGANIGRLYAPQIPKNGPLPVFDLTWNSDVDPDAVWVNQYGDESTQAQNPANYLGWNGSDYMLDLISDVEGDRDLLTTNASLNKTKTESWALNWQGYFLNGHVVPSIGIRHDEQESYSLGGGDLPRRANGSDTIAVESPDYRLPYSPDVIVADDSESYSMVVHVPDAWTEALPWDTGISFSYNKSENFQPSAGRIDVYGNPIASPKGSTEDYGFRISMLEDRISFRATWYETDVSDAKLDSFGGAYMIWGAEAWGYGFARGNLLRANVGGWANYTEGYDPLGIAGDETPEDGWSDEDIAYAQAVGDAITQAYMDTRLEDSWYKLWAIDIASADQGNFIAGSEPNGFTVTGDTHSEGLELEFAAQPTNNWNITANASKTEAQRINMAGSLVEWTENRYEIYNTPVMLDGEQVGVVGDVRFWNGGYNPNETLLGKFTREYMSGYWLYRMQEGANVPELRPWRFNLITNYSFEDGALGGLNIGGAYRWQDGQVVGYPILDGATIDDPRAFDLTDPYTSPAEKNIDMWVGYSRPLNDRVDWRIQLNVRNVLDDDDLIPITVQPDGSPAAVRIPEGRTWQISNTFTF